MISHIACIGIGLALAAGAYTDYKTRTIPNSIPLTILALGCFTATSWVAKVASFVLIVLILIIAPKLTGQHSGGGDIKLYCALSFALGLTPLAAILVLTLALAAIVPAIIGKRREKGTRIPLCTYVAPAYWLLWLTPFI